MGVLNTESVNHGARQSASLARFADIVTVALASGHVEGVGVVLGREQGRPEVALGEGYPARYLTGLGVTSQLDPALGVLFQTVDVGASAPDIPRGAG